MTTTTRHHRLIEDTGTGQVIAGIFADLVYWAGLVVSLLAAGASRAFSGSRGGSWRW